MNIAQHNARLGLFHLKESVLSVLFESQNQNEIGLQPHKIRKRLGIRKSESEQDAQRGNDLIFGVLHHLKDEGRVTSGEGRAKWKITDSEASLLKI